MPRILTVFLTILTFVAACAPTSEIRVGPNGEPVPQVYRITPRNADDVQFRMLDGINSLRQAAGAAPVVLNAELTAAAATHSRDMSVQNRPWHFGSDGSSPLDRAARVGYQGRLLGENISETYETELETLSAWMAEPATRGVNLDGEARQKGFSWFQEHNGKIWWTLDLGT